MAAVKSLHIHHYNAGYIIFSFGSLSPSGYFETRIPLKPALGAHVALQTTVLHTKGLNQTESAIVMILCVFVSKVNFFTLIE